MVGTDQYYFAITSVASKGVSFRLIEDGKNFYTMGNIYEVNPDTMKFTPLDNVEIEIQTMEKLANLFKYNIYSVCTVQHLCSMKVATGYADNLVYKNIYVLIANNYSLETMIVTLLSRRFNCRICYLEVDQGITTVSDSIIFYNTHIAHPVSYQVLYDLNIYENKCLHRTILTNVYLGKRLSLFQEDVYFRNNPRPEVDETREKYPVKLELKTFHRLERRKDKVALHCKRCSYTTLDPSHQHDCQHMHQSMSYVYSDLLTQSYVNSWLYLGMRQFDPTVTLLVITSVDYNVSHMIYDLRFTNIEKKRIFAKFQIELLQ